VPSAIFGGLWGAVPWSSPLILALIIVILAAGQIWMVRTQLIHTLYRWAAVPVISFSILAIGAVFALIGYAFVRIALEPGLVLN
jgi:hypothetical protein